MLPRTHPSQGQPKTSPTQQLCGTHSAARLRVQSKRSRASNVPTSIDPRLCQRHLLERLKATAREDEVETQMDPSALDAAQFPFALPKRPKFKPFIGESDVRQALLAFRHQFDLPEGRLLVRPMSEQDIPAATELLATSFAEAVGYMPMYRGLLKQEVQQYLRSHLDIAPKAVILVAMLKQPEDGSDEENSEAALSTVSAERLEEGNGEPDSSSTWFEETQDSSSSSSSTSKDLRPSERQISNPLQPGVPSPSRLLESLGERPRDAEELGGGEPAASRAVDRDSDTREASQSSRKASENVTSDSADSYSSFSEEKAQGFRDEAELLEASGGSGSSSDDGSDLERELAEEEERQEAARRRGELVGTVELSFSSATRTPSMTLNPPKDCAYLCNMAVGEDHQRRGHGSRLLVAAEQVVQLAGFRRVYLHVRLRDAAAKGLYHKAGFELEKEDCALVSLWDNRRQLRSKFLPRREAAPKDAEPPEEEEPLYTEY